MNTRMVRSSMGDVTDWFGTTEDVCPTSSSIVTMRAMRAELESSWQTTGVYSWQEMSALIASISKLASQASSAAVSFFSGNSTPAAKDAVRSRLAKYNDVAKQAVDYTIAWQQAKGAGLAVSAPGLKQWVLADLQAAIDLLRTIEVAVCGAPWWLNTVVACATFFIDVVDTAKRIGKMVLKLGAAVVKAAEDATGILAFLLRVAPYAAVGVGAYALHRAGKHKRWW